MKRAALVLMLIGCASEPADVEPLGDYTQWKRIVTWGEAPGHGDTYRVIYANPTATEFTGGFAVGSTLVKEVYNRVGDGPGSLRVIEFMRNVDTLDSDDGGWLFTAASTPDSEETVQAFCWRRCHAAAPFAGAWLDYSK